MTIQHIYDEEGRKFEEGNYSFRFEYTDKEGNWRWETAFINDNVQRNKALIMVAKHVSEYPNGKITDFIENNYFKSFLLQSNSRITKAIVEMADNYIEENRHKVERIDRYVLDDFRHFLQDLIK